MSTIAQRARMEADEAEQEEQGEQEEGGEVERPAEEPETVEEPTAPPPMTEKQAEAKSKKLDALATKYIEQAMPIALELGLPVVACPLCTYPAMAQPRTANEVTSDVEAAVLSLIGRSSEPDYIDSGQYERCAHCDGWGDVLTGAQKEISRTAMCTPCGGKGYLMRTNVTPIVTTPAAPPYPGATVPYTPIPNGLPDQWGRPAGHTHWGLDPAQVGG